MYYRLARRSNTSPDWHWTSTVLSSLGTVLQFLRLYQALPRDRLLVCSTPSREHLNELLARTNEGLESGAVTATQFLQERLIHSSSGSQRVSPWERQEQRESASVAVATHALWTKGGPAVLASDETCEPALEQQRRVMEEGAGGDHDAPYAFALPLTVLQALAWVRLLAASSAGNSSHSFSIGTEPCRKERERCYDRNNEAHQR